MTVIDLRDELYKRQIEIIEISDECVYYAEELNVKGIDTIFLYCYSFSEESEKMMSYFMFDDATYIQHYYACKNSIIVLFENDGNNAWIVKVDRQTNDEVFRKKVPLIGSFSECVAIDDDNIIIYSKADDEHKELFNRCLEETNCDVLAHLYDLEFGRRYFVKDFKTAMLIKNNTQRLVDKNGRDMIILGDPYCESESEKESLSRELGALTENIRDNIWRISVSKLLEGIKTDKKKLPLKRVASAGNEGIIRLECSGNDNIIVRARLFRTGQEQFFELPPYDERAHCVYKVRNPDGRYKYFTDKNSEKIYYLTDENDLVTLHGIVNSSALITYPDRVGKLKGCIDDRFVIGDSSKSYAEPSVSIYDGRLNTIDTYQARVKIKDNVLVFY